MNRREMLAGVVALPFAPSMLLKEPTASPEDVQITLFDGEKATPAKITHCPRKWPGTIKATLTETGGKFDRMELTIPNPGGLSGRLKSFKDLPINLSGYRLREGDTLNITWQIVVVV